MKNIKIIKVRINIFNKVIESEYLEHKSQMLTKLSQEGHIIEVGLEKLLRSDIVQLRTFAEARNCCLCKSRRI